MSVFSLESDNKKIRSESDPNIIGCVFFYVILLQQFLKINKKIWQVTQLSTPLMQIHFLDRTHVKVFEHLSTDLTIDEFMMLVRCIIIGVNLNLLHAHNVVPWQSYISRNNTCADIICILKLMLSVTCTIYNKNTCSILS